MPGYLREAREESRRGSDARREVSGYGSYLVQALKRICYEIGKTPAARCSASNTASRQTMQKAGLLPCGHILVGDVVK
jgi:hypothetical protein